MKNLIVTGLCIVYILCLSATLHAQKPLNANSKIEKITVFTNNAQIERSAFVSIPAGMSEITISGLSQYIDANTLRISGKGSFVIMSQQVQIKYPEPEETEDEAIPNYILKGIKNLTDSLELLAFDIHENNARKEALVNEKNLLQSSTAITKADTITELRDALAYYRQRLNDINQEWIKAAKTERLLSIQKKDMEERLEKLNNYSKNDEPVKAEKQPEAVVSIMVNADKALADARIDISYIAAGVSWTPFYELRVDEISKPVQLILKANLTQSTGEKWDKAKLTFSTGKPAAYKVLPILSSWYLGYYEPQRYSATATGGGVPMARAEVAQKERRKDANEPVAAMDMEEDANFASNYMQVNQSLISAEYVVSMPYTINSDGKVNTITLMSETLDASYKFLSVPKIDKDVFLTAYLLGWEKLNLIQGYANIIYQNSIISKTYINTTSVMDTLMVSLGTDKRVVVDRKKISDKSKDKIIGGTRERTVHFEITVKNQNQSEIDFLLKDQVPISNIEDIKVEVEEVSGAKYEELTGALEWNLKLKPGEQKKLTLRYTLKYDKNKTVLSE